MERMAKSKQDVSSRKKHKKIQSPKSRKDSISSKTSDSHADPANCATSPKLTIKKVHRKQKELTRIINLKCAIVLREDVSYLEYQEIREEICRLNVFKDLLDRQEAALQG